jgi:hypothetical protein
MRFHPYRKTILRDKQLNLNNQHRRLSNQLNNSRLLLLLLPLQLQLQK